ncbi:MAG: hypothetical protein CMN25_12810 [Salinicola sp.]|uniref:DUF3253 domain-containing protein n=1 Tax=uncultured Salinicola sp. TaxID=1193542 RepID=UPI000C94B696|nr:DUF3253 domain-containing protein [uncultured Salinicola sp.]MAM58208.1 hypothetical protein [Salinicola sp.]
MASSTDPATLRRAILALADSRGPAKTFCPSEVARQLDDDWRPLMAPIRACSRELVREGCLRVLQRGGGAVAGRALAWGDPAAGDGPSRWVTTLGVSVAPASA